MVFMKGDISNMFLLFHDKGNNHHYHPISVTIKIAHRKLSPNDL